jgi:hypothetical protein
MRPASWRWLNPLRRRSDRHHHRRHHHHRLGFGLLIHGRVAASAIVVYGAELNQQAVIATDDFP